VPSRRAETSNDSLARRNHADGGGVSSGGPRRAPRRRPTTLWAGRPVLLSRRHQSCERSSTETRPRGGAEESRKAAGGTMSVATRRRGPMHWPCQRTTTRDDFGADGGGGSGDGAGNRLRVIGGDRCAGRADERQHGTTSEPTVAVAVATA
jgi:hypothetical protein